MRAFVNGFIESLESPAVEKGTVLMGDDGKIAALGSSVAIPEGAEVIDLSGLYVTPGLVDAHTHIGTFNYSIPANMIDGNEKSAPITPQVRALDAFFPGDEAIPEALSGGVTCVQSLPGSANVIGGTGIILKLKGTVVDQMVIQSPSVMKAALGENPIRVYGAEQKKAPATRMGVAALMRQTLANAVTYRDKIAKGEKVDRDLGLEALIPVVNGQRTFSVHCHRSDDICTAIRIAKEFNLKYTLEHCTDGCLILDYLAENQVRAAIGPTLGGKSKMELKNKSFETPLALYKAGVHFCIITDHPFIPLSQFTVAATLAMTAGLPREEALKAITIYGAEHLGLQDRLGSLAPGKDGDLAVWTGDPLDARNRCVMTVIDGEPVYDGR